MSRVDDHKTRWLHNRGLVVLLDDEHADWMVTAAFYAAVHAVGALLASDGVRAPANHTGRFNVLKQTNRYQRVSDLYEPLFDASLSSRYGCSSAVWIDAEQVRTEVLPQLLFPLEKSVVKLLKDAAPELPPLLPA